MSHAINPPSCGKKGGGHKNGALLCKTLICVSRRNRLILWVQFGSLVSYSPQLGDPWPKVGRLWMLTSGWCGHRGT